MISSFFSFGNILYAKMDMEGNNEVSSNNDDDAGCDSPPPPGAFSDSDSDVPDLIESL